MYCQWGSLSWMSLGTEVHSRPKIKLVYSYHHKRYWKDGLFLVPNFYLYSQIRPKMEYCCHICAGATQPSPSSLDKSNYVALWIMNYFPPCNPFSTDETLVASNYSITINIPNVQTSYIPYFHQLWPSQLGPAMPCTQRQLILIPFVLLS